MSDTVKLIIEIPKRDYEEIKKVGTFTFPRLSKAIREATTLDDVKAEIDEQYDGVKPYNIDVAQGLEIALDILDNIGKAESEE